jgi:hypothetical protein
MFVRKTINSKKSSKKLEDKILSVIQYGCHRE